MAMTRADKLVTKVLLCVIVMSGAVACLTSCSKESEDEMVNGQSSMVNDTQVSITFSPYEMTPMTRAATSISGIVTKLDVWISDGVTSTDLHQTSSDDGFGLISVSLNRTKTYTLTAVAHRASGAATLTDGVIAFPDEKVTHAMICQTTFSPATTTSLSCLMQRIVAMIRFEIADQVPANAYTMRFELGESFTQWNLSTATGANAIERTTSFNNFSRANDGTAAFSVYVIPTNLTNTDNINVTVTALTQGGDEIESKTFEDVPVKAGYKTTYHGEFFTTEGATGSFTVEEDWGTFDTITY
jgi:hypothetical protein